MLPGVDQALARAVHAQGIGSYDRLIAKYDEETLAEVKKKVGGKLHKVGNGARKILNHAKAFQTGEIIQLQAFAIKKAPNQYPAALQQGTEVDRHIKAGA